jgi:predicted TIM-barrel fold metal-dependent hydrolase
MFPDLPIVLNHHGFAWDRSEEGLRRWRGWLETIARQPNVHVKLSEFGVRGQPFSWAEVTRIVRETVAVFGWQRCMFASNFPVAGLRIGYPELVTGVARALDGLSPDRRRAVMRDNALQFYRIETGPE